MFVEKLNDEDFIEILKIMLKNEGINPKVHALESDLYNSIVLNMDVLKEISFRNRTRTSKVFLVNKDSIQDTECTVQKFGKTHSEDYVKYSIDIMCIRHTPTLFNDRKIKRELLLGSILVNDFDLYWDSYGEAKVDKNKFYQFMYKKFGEEYKIELEKHFERESKEKFEKAKKEIEELQK